MQYDVPERPSQPAQDSPVWVWRRCVHCGRTSPGQALSCAADGAPMELVSPPDDGAFSVQWVALEQRTRTNLEEQEAEDALQLEDVHETIFGRELLAFASMRRAYITEIWPEYKTTP